MFSDPVAIRYVPFELACDRDAQRKSFLQQIDDGERFKFHFGIEWKNSKAPEGEGAIGVAMLRPAEDGHACEVGYLIVRRHWGKGLAAEAARVVIDQVAPAMNVPEADLYAIIEEGNKSSFRVAEKLGFRKKEKKVEGGHVMWILGLDS